MSYPIIPSRSLADVIREREAQNEKWGEQDHDPFTYLSILMEEVGELAQAAVDLRFGGKAAGNLRLEAVQTAAVALAIVETIDRGIWRWPVEGTHAAQLIHDLIDEDPCEYDHNECCQAHRGDERPCPHERGQQFLDEINLRSEIEKK